MSQLMSASFSIASSGEADSGSSASGFAAIKNERARSDPRRGSSRDGVEIAAIADATRTSSISAAVKKT